MVRSSRAAVIDDFWPSRPQAPRPAHLHTLRTVRGSEAALVTGSRGYD